MIKPLPDRLLAELTAYRTVALQDAVARNPQVALTALLHKLVSQYGPLGGCCPDAPSRPRSSAVIPLAQPDDLESLPPVLSISERHKAWLEDIPQGDDDALGFLSPVSTMPAGRRCRALRFLRDQRPAREAESSYSGYGLSEHALSCRMARPIGLRWPPVSTCSKPAGSRRWRTTSARYSSRRT